MGAFRTHTFLTPEVLPNIFHIVFSGRAYDRCFAIYRLLIHQITISMMSVLVF